MKKIILNNIITAIDIGTTKISVVIGQKISNKEIDILGFGSFKSEGLRKGVVIDITQAVASIKYAIKEAEVMSGIFIDSAVIGISGAHIQSKNTHGAIPLENGEVKQEDITRVINAAKAVPLVEGQQILHVIPQFFSVDNQEKIQNPLGMYGIRLEVQVHIITGSISSVQNLIRCCELANVKVVDIILEQLASGYAVLNDDERNLGVAMLDIGGGTSDLALYKYGSICHTAVIPIAGNQFTNDLAIGLRTSMKDAEKIKREYGFAQKNILEINQKNEIEIATIQGINTQIVKLSDMSFILESRAHELLSLVYEDIVIHNLKNMLVSGLVLTGGGSLLNGLVGVAETIFHVPVRVGYPFIASEKFDRLKSPIYATAYGLLLYTAQNHALTLNNGTKFTQLLVRMKSWVIDFF